MAALSRVTTGILLLLAALTELTTASESVGLIRRTSTPLTRRSSTFPNSLEGSFCESRTISSYPNSLAFFTAPSFNVTKKGLFCVDTTRPIFSPAAEAAEETATSRAATPKTFRNFFIYTTPYLFVRLFVY